MPRSRLLAAAPWIVVLAGVLVMMVLLVAATGYLSGGRPRAGAPDPVWPFAPGNTVSPGTTVSPAAGDSAPAGTPTSPGVRPPLAASRSVGTGTTGTRPTPSRAPSTAPPRPVAPAPTEAELTGRYRVLASYRDSFIGEVLVDNGSDEPRQWTVELRFPDGVGRLRAYWVESAPQATLRRSGDRYIFTSTERLAGGSAVPLRFHVERYGRIETPRTCIVSGTPCTVR